MKLTRLGTPIIMALLLGLSSLGCKHTKTGTTPLPNGGAGTTGTGADPRTAGPSGQLDTSSGIEGKAGSEVAIPAGQGHPGWNKDADALKAQTVRFDYDSTVIKASEKTKVAAVADYLKANSAKAVEVDGHCDERGTDEYNRSLGERRALGIRAELVRLGVDPNRVDTVSFGRDRPIDTGHSEAAHSRNRRGEFVVLTAP